MDRRDFLTSASLGLSALAFGSANAQEVSFAGELVELIIPFKEGGGSDTWGRFNAPFFSRFLPGQPTVVVRNVPGGNSIAGANRFASRARPDGLSVLGTSASTQFPYLMADPRVDYDYAEWRVVMAYGTGGVAYVSSELGVENIADLANVMDRELLYGSQGPTSLDLVPVLGFKLLGLNVRPIFGMSGRGAGRLAFERGELNLDYQTSTAYLRNVVPLIEQGDAVPLFSWGALTRNRESDSRPDVPRPAPLRRSLRVLHGQPPSRAAPGTAGSRSSRRASRHRNLFVAPRRRPMRSSRLARTPSRR